MKNAFLQHVQHELHKNLFDYLLLSTVGIFFLLTLRLLAGERVLEFIVLFAFVSFYVIWGIYHHIQKDDLHLKIVLEYILIGFTALFLLRILILP